MLQAQTIALQLSLFHSFTIQVGSNEWSSSKFQITVSLWVYVLTWKEEHEGMGYNPPGLNSGMTSHRTHL